MKLHPFPPGMAVVIKRGESIDHVPATVLGFWVRHGGYLMYMLSWWNDGTREEEWVDAIEVVAADDNVQFATVILPGLTIE